MGGLIEGSDDVDTFWGYRQMYCIYNILQIDIHVRLIIIEIIALFVVQDSRQYKNGTRFV